ncbi:hypothetical protein [Francisella uliginis]|uniref:Uncharacterized protein n=1 Tax=Francisella uliginis TaxID=573570 RepID=A0A1L4BUM7_9GAMM|nr:hypothetical protein [Francisella uliginis]API87538.1 hypothetical protein F7310_09300 [Francisella uliginis]
MNNVKLRFLLSKKYLNIKDIREVLLLHDIDLDIEQIIDWLEQNQEIYCDINCFLLMLKETGGDISEISKEFIGVEQPIQNIKGYDISLLIKQTLAIETQSESETECNYPPMFKEIILSDEKEKYSQFESIKSLLIGSIYTKSSFIEEYLNNLQDHQRKPATNQDDNYRYSEALKPYLDTNHPNYSSRLAICIDVWNYLFLDDNYDKNVSIKENLKRWNKKTNQQLEISDNLLNAMQSILNFDNRLDRTGKLLKGYTPKIQKN